MDQTVSRQTYSKLLDERGNGALHKFFSRLPMKENARKNEERTLIILIYLESFSKNNTPKNIL